MDTTKGILLTAVGHPYYGRMAYNLAVTIKVVEPEIPIAIVTDGLAISHLNEDQLALFSHIIPTSEEGSMTGANNIRLSYPSITPFKETLALDADMLWLSKSPYELFEHLSDRDFTAVNEGYIDSEDHTTKTYTFWADPKETVSAYGLSGRFYQLRGEVILFRNTPAVKKMYAAARKVMAKPKVHVKTHGNAVTEEFALNVATCMSGMEPHESNWQPSYWPGKFGNRVPTIRDLNEDYYAFSVGGNSATHDVKKTYDIIAAAAANKLGLKHRFPLKAKRTYLPDRIHA